MDELKVNIKDTGLAREQLERHQQVSDRGFVEMALSTVQNSLRFINELDEMVADYEDLRKAAMLASARTFAAQMVGDALVRNRQVEIKVLLQGAPPEQPLDPDDIKKRIVAVSQQARDQFAQIEDRQPTPEELFQITIPELTDLCCNLIKTNPETEAKVKLWLCAGSLNRFGVKVEQPIL